MIRIVARMLAFTLLASTLLMGSEGEPGRHKKHAAKPKGPTVEEQLQQLKDQLDQQQDQIKQQQDHIQTLEQQLQQNNAKVEQQNQQLQNFRSSGRPESDSRPGFSKLAEQ